MKKNDIKIKSNSRSAKYFGSNEPSWPTLPQRLLNRLVEFWYSKRIFIGFSFPVVKSYLIKTKLKYDFNKWLSKNNFQFFYEVLILSRGIGVKILEVVVWLQISNLPSQLESADATRISGS